MTRFTFQGTGQTVGGGKAVLLVTGTVILLGYGAAAEIATAVVELLITVIVLVVLTVAGLGVFLAHRARQGKPLQVVPSRIIPEPVRYEFPAPEPERPALEPPAPRELHQHVHNDVHLYVGPGADPKVVADVAEILRRQRPE